MRLKLDENLPESLVAELTALHHDVDSVGTQGLHGQADSEVWQAAQMSEQFLITQNLDFSDIDKFPPGSHHGLMLVRLRLPGRQALTKHIVHAFRLGGAPSWARCVVVLTERKLRVHAPPR